MRASKPQANQPAQSATGDVCETECVDTECVDEVRLGRARRSMKPAATIGALAETFRVLGDPTRVSIAWALSREELCVCEIADLLGMSQSAVSHSLRALRQLRLVRFRKVGRVAYYALDDAHIGQLLCVRMDHMEEVA